MAREIPINSAGLQYGNRTNATLASPIREADHQALGGHSFVPNSRPLFIRRALFLLSGLICGLAVISALGLWPELSATRFGLDDRGMFCLLVSGAYLMATNLYAALKTRMLADLNQASWDARLMAYANLTVGRLVVAAISVVVLAAVAVFLAFGWLGAFLLSRLWDRSQS